MHATSRARPPLQRARALTCLARPLLSTCSAHSQYPLGHACDNATRWLNAEKPFLAKYTFGCEPYILYNKRAAPRLWEMFVAYGKDRVSFTYELAARGFVFVVQPDVFVIHHRTPPLSGTVQYGHQPEEWMIGETCWPDFENRIKLKYNYREGWCTQSAMGAAVNVSVFNGSLMCISQMERLCVLNCRPTTMRWQGKRVIALRRRAAAAGVLDASLSGRNASIAGGHDADDDGQHASADERDLAAADAAVAPSLRLPGTSNRPPKLTSHYFKYPLAKRDADRQECCRVAPKAARCEPKGEAPPPPPLGVDRPVSLL